MTRIRVMVTRRKGKIEDMTSIGLRIRVRMVHDMTRQKK